MALFLLRTWGRVLLGRGRVLLGWERAAVIPNVPCLIRNHMPFHFLGGPVSHANQITIQFSHPQSFELEHHERYRSDSGFDLPSRRIPFTPGPSVIVTQNY